MLLAVDIGNTFITLGAFRGRRLVKRATLPTKNKTHFYGLKNFISGNTIEDAIICSVVPQATVALAKDLRRLIGTKPYIVGKNIRVPVKNLYHMPNQVGMDRLVNAYAGIKLYKAPLIAVDFGTAITFDVVSKKGEYLGGMILPGLRISLEALAERTALLPRIKLSRPKEFIGKDTRNSMLSGIIYGFAALTDDLSQRIKRLIGKNARVIGTGGNIKLICKYCKKIDVVDRDITLKGLNLIYEAAKCKKY
ncbi:MAG: type III pantothenate kinase [Candidatus Omnitrophica bacterium]|nr:type III pantothenate kinase [Candidatus Omnitrophota bacterium]